MKRSICGVLIALASLAGLNTGCETLGGGTKTMEGAGIGTLAGAALGAAWGAARGDWAKGAMIGAAAGAAVGGVTGAVLDKQQEDLRKAGIRTERDKEGNLLVTMSGESLKFDTGKATLQPAGEDELSKLSGVMSKYPENRMAIGGFTDNVGGDAMNLSLSQARAERVKGYLLEKGVPSRCILTATGYGKDYPMADNSTAEGRSQNRRVEIKISADQDEAAKNEKDRESYKNRNNQ
jgi:outer membrane protein OmpA-like peptidoglycan-associated protein